MSHIPKLSLLSNTIPKHQTWTKRNWIGLSPIGISLNITKDWTLDKNRGYSWIVHSAFLFLRSANARLSGISAAFSALKSCTLPPLALPTKNHLQVLLLRVPFFNLCLCHGGNQQGHRYEGHAPNRKHTEVSPRTNDDIRTCGPYFRGFIYKFQVFRVRSVKVSKKNPMDFGPIEITCGTATAFLMFSLLSFGSNCWNEKNNNGQTKYQKNYTYTFTWLLSQLVVTRS